MLKLSPLNQRRWHQFKANRRGWYSLWIFLALFGVTLCSDFIANDKPLLVVYEGELYWPIFKAYPETTFGGDFATEAAYKDPYVQGLIKESGWMLWPLIPYSYDTHDSDLRRPAPTAPPWWPVAQTAGADDGEPFDPWANPPYHWLGTDDQGRDVVARVLYGFRISVLFGLALTALSSVIGVAAGAVQGYFGGKTDLVGQRLIEIWQGLPALYVLIIIASFIQPGFWSLLGVLLLFSWTTLVGVVRAEFLRVRNFDYVRAAKALGVADATIMTRHVLPNAMVATMTFVPFILSGSIVTLTSLDFLGLGMPPGAPSLGELLQQGKNNLQAPWLGITGFLVIAVQLSLLVFVGEAVRDAFDPRKLKLGGGQ